MRKLITLSALLIFASALACAETWTGQLLDAHCVAQHKTDEGYKACNPAMGTTSFAIEASGRALTLDAAGNKKAAEAWKEYNSSADREKDPNAKAAPMATVEGTLTGDQIKVETIKLQ